MLNKFIPKCSAILALSILAASACAAPVVIVNSANDSAITAKNVKRIFLGKEKKFSNGNQTLPVNQVATSGTRQSFDSEVLGRSSTQVSAYWSKLVFTGKGIPPKEVNDDAAVIAIVEANPDAIGYVDSASVSGSVKVISL